MAFIGGVASLAPSCGGSSETDGSTTGVNPTGGQVCAPNKTESCACAGGTMGVQTCNATGTSFGACDCGTTEAICGNGKLEGAEQCDDGNTAANDGCNADCTLGVSDCGNSMINPGECGPEGTCQKDCGVCGNGQEDANECGIDGNCPFDCDLCKDHVTFAGLTAPSLSVWSYGGQTGIDAGNAQCAKLGADHICTHKELRKAENHVVDGKNELASIPAGTTIWLHREDTDMVDVNGKMTAGGAGARCNDWKYGTNHISDGEHCDVSAGKMTCSYDSDPIYDTNAPAGTHIQPGLDCNGANRAIACCFEECKAMP